MCQVVLFVPMASSITTSVPTHDLDILFHVPSLLPGTFSASGKTDRGKRG